MNILYILQQSIYNDKGKWLNADSNINMMSGIVNELKEKTNWNFYILISKLDDFEDLDDYKKIIDHERVHFVPYNFPVSAFLNRQHFNTFEFIEMLKNIPEIHVVWNNIPELTRNIKTLFRFSINTDPFFITSCYWMDLPYINQDKIEIDISYFFRQFDGYECSDICTFTCNSVFENFIEHSNKMFSKYLVAKIYENSKIFDFGFSLKELLGYKINQKFEKKTILFLNRFSGINYTHHKEFIKAINLLSCKRNDFQVVVTNPSKKMTINELKSLIPNLFLYKEGKALNRKEYIELLWKSDISVHLFTKELYGGCAHTESLFCDNITIVPKINEYKRRCGQNYEFYCDVNPASISEKLNKALDVKNFDNKYIKFRNEQSSYEKISSKIIEDIESLWKR